MCKAVKYYRIKRGAQIHKDKLHIKNVWAASIFNIFPIYERYKNIIEL